MLQLENVIYYVTKFLTLKELLLLYICNKSFKEQTHNIIPFWKHYCDQLSTLLKLNTIEKPKYDNYITMKKLNNDTLRRAVIIYLEYPQKIKSLLGKITFWDTSLVTDMSHMFCNSQTFNQLLNFNTSSVTNNDNMFEEAEAFNQPLNFDTSSVTNMFCMFCGAEAFNQPLSFDTSSVINMSGMFYGAEAFDLLNWMPINDS